MSEQTDSQPATKTYHGNCHCASFRFTLTVPEITAAYECNCSVCSRKGYKFTFPPAGSFTVTTPDFELKTYEFGPQITSHKFCPKCGTAIMAVMKGKPPGQDMAVNLRTLQDLDPLALPAYPFDGRSIEPAWVPHILETTSISTGKLYTGSCHCGNVKFALNQPNPIGSSDGKITDCDCSICVRNATTLTFPSPSNIKTEIATPLTKYEFASKQFSHEFCPTCGCQVRVKKAGADTETTPVPVNLRMFEDINFEEFKDKITHYHFKNKEPLYVVS